MNHFSSGGHFAAFEEPGLLSSDIWSFIEKVESDIKEANAARLLKAKEEAKNKKTNV